MASDVAGGWRARWDRATYVARRRDEGSVEGSSDCWDVSEMQAGELLVLFYQEERGGRADLCTMLWVVSACEKGCSVSDLGRRAA